MVWQLLAHKSLFFYYLLIILFLKDFLNLFLERRRQGERDEERHQCAIASCAPPTGDLPNNPGLCWRLGIELVTLIGRHSIHWATVAGIFIILFSIPTTENLLLLQHVGVNSSLNTTLFNFINLICLHLHLVEFFFHIHLEKFTFCFCWVVCPVNIN